ncbi:NTF2-like domain containing protein [Quillaja saponaria]|uniref:NTF2-like domain containing protein n=1 Tax=Quillaja saponaria TaxID=32244 RepID=A0AAD7LSZ2_QUISA|nr:NTF2-like domain containing protein [Quillaja saponaria]
MPYGLFSAPVKQGSRPSKEEEEKQDYYLNMGYAIRTLREEFPEVFYKELSFDIYRIFFKALCIDLVSVWQPVENTIMVRWTIHGVPRIPWESRGRFDGTSIYKLDREGKIFEHRVDNIALNSPPKFSVLGVEDLIKSLGYPSTPRPTYFEISSTSSSSSERT